MRGREVVENQCNKVQPRGVPKQGFVMRSRRACSTPQDYTCLQCWQLWPVVGGTGNGAAEEDWHWDINPGMAAIRCLFLGPCVFLGTTHLWQRVRTVWLWGAPFCHVAQEAGETLPGRKGEKGLLLVGHEKMPHGSGLTGDRGGDTADGARA